MPKKGAFFIALSICFGLNLTAVYADTTGGADVEDSYPHITQLETFILGNTFVQDPLRDRLARLETKAFGKPSTDPDLSARTDALTDYADQKLGKRTPVATDDMDVDAGAGVAPPPKSDYPHITALEKQILGQTYPDDGLQARLNRMEVKAFGVGSTDPDLTNRTDALDDYVQKKLHQKSFDKQEAEQAKKDGMLSASAPPTSSGVSKSKQILGMIGTQLLGMAVPGAGIATALAAAAAQQQNSSSDAPPEHRVVDDPAIFSSAPPPPGSRMITQVAWCEMRVFGHTSPQLHLPERLQQLNYELNYAPNQKGAELMDDMPKLMQAVQTRLQAQSQSESTQ